MPPRKTHEQFVQEVKEVGNGEYKVMGNYVNNLTKIKLYHSVCNTEFERVPKFFLNKRSMCPTCGREKLRNMHSKSHEEFKKEFEKIAKGEYELIGIYKGSMKKVEVKHNSCQGIFEVTPNNFLSKGSGCPKCYGNLRKTTQKFKSEVREITDGEYEVLGDYKNNRTKIEILHKDCSQTFLMAPHKFLAGNRCTSCNETKGEHKIRKVLQGIGVEFEREYRFEDCRGVKYPLPFDFAVFQSGELSMLIEFDGEQHFKPVKFNGISEERAMLAHEGVVKRDAIKSSYCKNKGIKLIRIPYTEYDRIESIIKSSMAIPSEV